MIPSEEAEQRMLFEWIGYQRGKFPELEMLFHIPNEKGTRNMLEVKKLSALGVKPGVPDLFLPVARWGYHGCFIEMKRQKGGRVRDSQRDWIALLTEQGYLVRVCKGFDEAKKALLMYLMGDKE